MAQSTKLNRYIVHSLKTLLMGLTLLSATAAMAGDPAVYSQCSTAAVSGADVVAYHGLEPGADAVLGSANHTHQWNGAEWRFANATNRDLFAENPEKYAPAYGGYCAFAASHGFTMYTVPDAWEIVDGTLYLNKSKGIQRKWKKKLTQKISSADANWPHLLEQCEDKDKCRPCWKK